MERLAKKELRALLECIKEGYPICDRETLQRVLSRLSKIVPTEVISYNRSNPLGRWNACASSLPKKICAQRVHEHRVPIHDGRTREIRAKAIGLLTSSRFHSLGLDKNFYQRPDMKCRTRLAKRVALKHKSEKVTVREQLLLKLLSPHLVQAYRNAKMLTHMQQKLSLIDRALNGLNVGIIVLAANGKVRLATASAAQQVTNYLGHCSSRGNRLPEALWNWVRQQNVASSEDMLQRHSPFVLEREGKRLGIRLVADFDQTLLLLEDQPTTIQPQERAPCGLSSREAQVLDWVAQGKTNKETGAILELSARTVQKHLEHIYQKMGVESRTAAAARTYQIASKATKQTSLRRH